MNYTEVETLEEYCHFENTSEATRAMLERLIAVASDQVDQYCGRVFDRKDLNLDHVTPRDRGGPTTWENIVCSCVECNTRKANRTPSEAGMHLIRKPKRPKWRPFVQVDLGFPHHDSWKHFLDLAYWNVELGEDIR